MKKTKLLCKMTALVLTLSIALPVGTSKVQTVSAEVNTETASQQYVDAMGRGWNLGNTLEAYDWNNMANSNENTWGQPTVTQEFMVGLKAKGFKSIRIPFAVDPGHTQDSSGHYLINETRLVRYKQVVDWAVAAGLYVQVDLHDPWHFLNNEHFNGDTSQESYKMFKDFWTELAVTFKDEPSQVCFETLNEPGFNDEKDSNGNITISAQDKLNLVNKAAYDAIRGAGGNDATRMIVIPSMNTNYGTTAAIYDWISALKDPNIIATVHWYSEWYWSAAIGRTGFDEELYPDRPGVTPRSQDQVFFDAINTNLISKGVGVVIGEFGMLTTFTQSGEETKYFEDMYNKAKQYKACLMLWDCNILNRNDMSWLRPLHGAVVDAALKGERSSYGTGLNETYLSKPVDNGVQIPLTLNGNTFTGIDGLTAGTDYTYDAATATVTLSKACVNSKFNALGAGQYGSIADLVFKFSAGADWHQTLIKYASPVLKAVTGTTSGISIPVDFKGTELRRARVVMLNDDGTDGKMLGGCSGWGWPWLTCGDGGDFFADYNKNVININSGCLTASYMPANGKVKFTFEMYDGQTVDYILTKSGSDITGQGTTIVNPVPTAVPTAKITADNSNVIIERNQSATFTVSMNQLANTNAFDVTLKYNNSLYNVSKIEYLVSGLTEVSKSDKDGNLRLIFGKTDKTTITAADYKDLVRVTLTPKSFNVSQDASVQLVNANTATINNNVAADAACTLGQTTGSATIKLASDINGIDGVTLADLSIALADYMDDKNSANWSDAKKADINGDGVVDIVDLQLIAGYIVSLTK